MSEWELKEDDPTLEDEYIVPVEIRDFSLKFPGYTTDFLRKNPGDNYSDSRIITHIPTGHMFSIYSNRGSTRIRQCDGRMHNCELTNKLVAFLQSKWVEQDDPIVEFDEPNIMIPMIIDLGSALKLSDVVESFSGSGGDFGGGGASGSWDSFSSDSSSDSSSSGGD